MSDPDLGDLRSELCASLSAAATVSIPAPRRFTTDFGRMVHARPDVVVQVSCEEDLVAVLRFARQRALAVGLRGAGHSVHGQSLSDGGILLVNVDRDRTPVCWLDDGRVEIAARSRWHRVERELNRRGRSVPVLPDYLDLSVGGTLSVGGYGVDSIHHGLQADHVERMRMVLPDGSAHWCSRDEDRGRFALALGGLGQAGVIERVVLRTTAYRPATALFNYHHSSLLEMVRSLGWIEGDRHGWPDTFKANFSRGRARSTYGRYDTRLRGALKATAPAVLADTAPASRIPAPRYRFVRSRVVGLWVSRFRSSCRLWSDYMVDYPGLVELARHVSDQIRRDAFGDCLKSAYVLGVRRPAGALQLPFEATGSAGTDPRFLFGLYCMVPSEDRDKRTRVEDAVDSCLERCIELGGRPYLYGWHRLAGDRGRRTYGEAFEQLSRVQPPDDRFRAGRALW